MWDLIHRYQQLFRLAGLTLLVAGLGVAIGIDAIAGFALMGAAALFLIVVQPLLLAHVRSRVARRRAPRNGHLPGAGADDVDLPSP